MGDMEDMTKQTYLDRIQEKKASMVIKVVVKLARREGIGTGLVLGLVCGRM